MNIGIDARWIFQEKSGIGYYTERLIHSFSILSPRDSIYIYFSDLSIAQKMIGRYQLSQKPHIHIKMVRGSVFSVFSQCMMPFVLWYHKIDVFHSPNFFIPLFFPGRKIVVTVHDMIPLKFPHYVPRSKKNRLLKIFYIVMWYILRKVKMIITDSECSKRDIMQLMDVPEEKVRVIPLGVDEAIESDPSASIQKRKNLSLSSAQRIPVLEEGYSRTYILAVGRADPYKNIERLVRAFVELKSDAVYEDVDLVIVGTLDKRYTEAQQARDNADCAACMYFTGYVDDVLLLMLYKQAGAFVHPSLYEGFGIPPLVALRQGIPVASSDRGSLKEVLGGAVLYFDPDDVSAMVQAMKRVLRDEPLRQELIARGKQWAQQYQWDRTARETLDVYRTIAELLI